MPRAAMGWVDPPHVKILARCPPPFQHVVEDIGWASETI
jgi:hypothetical protein